MDYIFQKGNYKVFFYCYYSDCVPVHATMWMVYEGSKVVEHL